MTDDEDANTITAEDVEWANRTTLGQTAALTRIAGSVLVVVGVVGAAASLWTTVRYQQDFGDAVDFSGEPGTSLLDRLDRFSITYGLVLPAIAVALGLALRLMADYTVVRTGGSLTGFEVGDQVPPEKDEDDEVDTVVPPPDPRGYEPGA